MVRTLTERNEPRDKNREKEFTFFFLPYGSVVATEFHFSDVITHTHFCMPTNNETISNSKYENPSKSKVSILPVVTSNSNCTGWSRKSSERLHLNVYLFLCARKTDSNERMSRIEFWMHIKGPKQIVYHNAIVNAVVMQKLITKCGVTHTHTLRSILSCARHLSSQMVDGVYVIPILCNNASPCHSRASHFAVLFPSEIWAMVLLSAIRSKFVEQQWWTMSRNATLKQWHSHPVNLQHNSIKIEREKQWERVKMTAEICRKSPPLIRSGTAFEPTKPSNSIDFQ